MKDKNIELCELLGIEPKKEIAMHCGTNCNRHNCIMDRDCEHYKPIGAYPDLSKPNNFVKLLEIKIYDNDTEKFSTLLEMATYLDWWLIDRKSFLEQLIDFIEEVEEENGTVFKNHLSVIQHQTQQIEWEY